MGIEYNKDTSYQTLKARVEQAEKKGFIDVQLFAPGIKNQSEQELNKSLKSIIAKKNLHLDKIKHPEKYIDEDKLSDAIYMQGMQRRWSKEIREFDCRIDEIKERLKNDFGRRDV